MGEKQNGGKQDRPDKTPRPKRLGISGAHSSGASGAPFDQMPFMSTKVEQRPPADVYLPNRRLRRIPDKVMARWKKVIEEFGFLLPLLVNSNYELLHGEAAYLAAQELQLPQVPVIRIDHLSREQQSAYRIWLDKAVESEEWDQAALTAELQDILAAEIDIDLTGFELPEIDAILHLDLGDGTRSHLDQTPDVAPAHSIPVRLGDIWICGQHLVVCGDARDLQLLKRILEHNKVRLVLTDPPYNIPIGGFVSGAGAHTHAEFVMGSKGMSDEEFQKFLSDFLRVLQSILMDGGLIYSFMDWRSIDVLTMTAKSLGLTHLNTCIWKKTNGGMGGLYRSAHEMIGVFKYGKAPHVNNVQLGKHGRNRTNVWEYEGCNSINPERRKELADHPTPKPVALLSDVMLDVTNRGDLVFDPFLGSGSTLIAAQEVDRVALGVELDPKFVDVTLRRWLALTGEEPVHADTGLTYSQMVERGRPDEPSDRITDNRDTDIGGGRVVPKKKSDGDYEVGYGKPPKAGQFKPGQSGNKKGRPKGSKNLKTDLQDVLSETITVTMNHKQKKITKQKAMLLSAVAKAVKGDMKATNTLIGLILKVLPEDLEAEEPDQLTETDQKILEQFAADVLKKAGKSGGSKS